MKGALLATLHRVGCALAGISILVMSPPAWAHTPQPILKWEPRIVLSTVARGDIDRISVRFTATQPLENLQLKVSPTIAGVVSLTPSNFASIREGQSVELTMSIDAPFRHRIPIIAGWVSASTSTAGRPQLLPLPVVVRTYAATTASIQGESGSVGISAPQGWAIVSDGVTSNLFSPSTAAALDQGDLHTPPDVAISIVPNANGDSLQQFVSAYAEGQFTQYLSSRSQEFIGQAGIVVDDEGSLASFEPRRAAFAALGSDFLIVLGFGMSAADFDLFLASLTIQ